MLIKKDKKISMKTKIKYKGESFDPGKKGSFDPGREWKLRSRQGHGSFDLARKWARTAFDPGKGIVF